MQNAKLKQAEHKTEVCRTLNGEKNTTYRKKHEHKAKTKTQNGSSLDSLVASAWVRSPLLVLTGFIFRLNGIIFSLAKVRIVPTLVYLLWMRRREC